MALAVFRQKHMTERVVQHGRNHFQLLRIAAPQAQEPLIDGNIIVIGGGHIMPPAGRDKNRIAGADHKLNRRGAAERRKAVKVRCGHIHQTDGRDLRIGIQTGSIFRSEQRDLLVAINLMVKIISCFKIF